ncbi:uncharacterized protein LOC120187627 [Hibiscus syriacus]|uniref:uncharacterized protein LOC120187627 n=1 Tax=Hibiscus syriacus TaxID=106335 RepID=UPI0019207365|nr:uncharacterized protein LOC120187627 [Hibiscus syriacus]
MDSSEQHKVDEVFQDVSASVEDGCQKEPTAVSVDKDGGYFVDVEIEKTNQEKEKEEVMAMPGKEEKEVATSNSIKIQEYNNDKDISSPKLYGNACNHYLPAIKSQAHLPKPETLPPPPPPTSTPKGERSQSLSIAETIPSIGKYITERSNSFSASIVRRLSSLKDDSDMFVKDDSLNFEVTEFKIPGVKVIVKLKTEAERLSLDLRGRISFFTRSNCRDCTAVRHFFREKGLVYVEINIDVFPKREKELMERTGRSDTPQIFFNDKWLGGLPALIKLKESQDYEAKLTELVGDRCPEGAPAVPVYGVNDEEDEDDDLVETVRYLRRSLPIHDRLLRMQMVKNCFSGADLLEATIEFLDCSRKKAIMTAKRMGHKHFFHHVFGENEFEEGNHYYRFLEHEPYIMGCFNYRISTNDCEPKSASFLADRLSKLMLAILEAYASDDRLHVNYHAIDKSEEFRRFLNVARDLQRVNMKLLTPNERLAFFLNLHNAMAIHAVISIGHPEGILDKRAFFNEFLYLVGGYPYSLNVIVNGTLRHNRTSPNSFIRPFSKGDRRLELVPPKVNPLIHFGLCNATRSSPAVRFFTADGVEDQLKCAAKEYFKRGAIGFDMDTRTVFLTRIIKWYNEDFGPQKETLKWVIKYLEPTQSGLLSHLLADDDEKINVIYQDYDWSVSLAVVREHMAAIGWKLHYGDADEYKEVELEELYTAVLVHLFSLPLNSFPVFVFLKSLFFFKEKNDFDLTKDGVLTVFDAIWHWSEKENASFLCHSTNYQMKMGGNIGSQDFPSSNNDYAALSVSFANNELETGQ